MNKSLRVFVVTVLLLKIQIFRYKLLCVRLSFKMKTLRYFETSGSLAQDTASHWPTRWKHYYTRGSPYPRFTAPPPRKNVENKRNKRFIIFKTRAKRERPVTWWNPAAPTRPVLDSSLFVPVLTLPRKFATVLLLAFSLFELVAALSQCLCSESNK